MPIKYTIKQDNDILKVESEGKCENFIELKKYLKALHEATISIGLKKVLVDETKLKYSLSTIQSYESGSFVAETAPSTVKIALVCRQDGWKEAKFWETVAVNRGARVKIFTGLEDAEKWIG